MSEEIVMCDKVEGERATMRYVWAWGEEGFCSAKGQFLVQQLSKNLKQPVSFVPLANLPPPSLTRDERTQLIAERLSAQAEVAEVSERNSRLYAANTELASQARQLTLRNEQADAEIERLTAEVATLKDANVKAGLELRSVSEQLHRANVLLEAGPGEAELEIANLRVQLEGARAEIESLKANVVE
jgi:hypothetical protein